MIHDSPSGDEELLARLASRRKPSPPSRKWELTRGARWRVKFERPDYDSALAWQLWIGPWLVRRYR